MGYYAEWSLLLLVALSPLWVPVAILAYAAYRRRFSVRLPFIGMALEALALTSAQWINSFAFMGYELKISAILGLD
jgi:hypothetical protein